MKRTTAQAHLSNMAAHFVPGSVIDIVESRKRACDFEKNPPHCASCIHVEMRRVATADRHKNQRWCKKHDFRVLQSSLCNDLRDIHGDTIASGNATKLFACTAEEGRRRP